MLEKWVTSWVKSWYFQENSELTQYDAYTWLRNSLINTNNVTNPNDINKSKIENNLREVAKLQSSASKYASITRREFLDIASKYLVLDTKKVNISITYKDLTEEENKLANYIFNQNITWKDDFWNSYFQPDKKITRWEWAYMLSTIFKNYSSVYVTLK
jgi:septum formation topological specificity factor MinE